MRRGLRTGHVSRTIARPVHLYHRPMTHDPGAAALLRSVGLLADGPAVWGRPVPAQGPGVFVIELSAPTPTAHLELTRVGKWIERVETLRLDGERPTSRALAARLASFWLPSQTVLYVGATSESIGRRRRVDRRRPSSATAGRTPAPTGSRRFARSMGRMSGGHRPRRPRSTRTPSSAAFAAGVPEADLAGLPDRTVVLPWANLRAATGERKATGLSGSLIAGAVAPPLPPTRVVVVPDGDAEGARGEPPSRDAGRLHPGGHGRAAAGRRAGEPAAARADAPVRPRPRRRRRPLRCRRRGPHGRGRCPPQGRARRADPGPPAPDPGPDPDRQGARRPQGERRIPRRSRGAVIPRGSGPGDRGAPPLGRHRRGAGGRLAGRSRVGGDPRRRRRDGRLHDRRCRPSRTRPVAASRPRRRSGGPWSGATRATTWSSATPRRRGPLPDRRID